MTSSNMHRPDRYGFVGGTDVTRFTPRSTKVWRPGCRRGSGAELAWNSFYILQSLNNLIEANIHIVCSVHVKGERMELCEESGGFKISAMTHAAPRTCRPPKGRRPRDRGRTQRRVARLLRRIARTIDRRPCRWMKSMWLAWRWAQRPMVPGEPELVVVFISLAHPLSASV